MKSARAAFIRLITTAVAIVLVSLAILTADRHSRPTTFSPDFASNAAAAFFHYLPPTLELIAVSFLAASVIGFGLTLLFGRRLKRVTTVIAVVLLSIPFFWLALGTYIVGDLAQIPSAGSTGADHFMLADHLSHLVLPAGVLALFQLPPIMEYFNVRFARGMNLRTAGASIAGGLGKQFAVILPDVVAATMFTEVVFVWPGEGRLFFALARYGGTGYQMVVFLSLTALFILVVRSTVNFVCRRADEATGADV